MPPHHLHGGNGIKLKKAKERGEGENLPPGSKSQGYFLSCGGGGGEGAGLCGFLAGPAALSRAGAGFGGCCGVRVPGERCRGVPPSPGVPGVGGGCRGCVTKHSHHAPLLSTCVGRTSNSLSHCQSIAHKNIHKR